MDASLSVAVGAATAHDHHPDDAPPGLDNPAAAMLAPAPVAPRRPIYITRAASAAAASGVATILDLGRPSAGRAWNVLSVTVIGSDDHTSLAGVSPTVYLGTPDANAVIYSQCLVPANGQTVPNVSSFTPGVVWAVNEHLFVIVYGAAAGQVLTAVARCTDYPAPSIFADGLR